MKKTILITGSNRGIGFEAARQLGRRGYHVILSGRDANKLGQAVKDLKEEGIAVESLLMDVSDEQSIRRAAEELVSRKIKPDVIINNAAVLMSQDRSILHADEEVLQHTLRTNSIGALRVCKAFIPLMNRPSRIINVSSGGGSMTDPVGGWSPVYCVSKSLLNAITRQLAHELQAENISVNACCPGWVRTEMGGKGANRTVAHGAETAVWLATDALQQLTGKFFRDKKVIPW